MLPPLPVHSGMASPLGRWKHVRPVEHCSLQSHSPVQARMFLELATLPPESSFIVSVGADVGACVVGAGGGACVDGAGVGACVVSMSVYERL